VLKIDRSLLSPAEARRLAGVLLRLADQAQGIETERESSAFDLAMLKAALTEPQRATLGAALLIDILASNSSPALSMPGTDQFGRQTSLTFAYIGTGLPELVQSFADFMKNKHGAIKSFRGAGVIRADVNSDLLPPGDPTTGDRHG
jgi:hypothetical protein